MNSLDISDGEVLHTKHGKLKQMSEPLSQIKIDPIISRDYIKDNHERQGLFDVPDLSSIKPKLDDEILEETKKNRYENTKTNAQLQVTNQMFDELSRTVKEQSDEISQIKKKYKNEIKRLKEDARFAQTKNFISNLVSGAIGGIIVLVITKVLGW